MEVEKENTLSQTSAQFLVYNLTCLSSLISMVINSFLKMVWFTVPSNCFHCLQGGMWRWSISTPQSTVQQWSLPWNFGCVLRRARVQFVRPHGGCRAWLRVSRRGLAALFCPHLLLFCPVTLRVSGPSRPYPTHPLLTTYGSVGPPRSSPDSRVQMKPWPAMFGLDWN